MFALNPRQMGADINLDRLQFFVDYCNSVILSGKHLSTGYLPTFKLLALGMDVEMTHPDKPEEVLVRDATLNETEKAFIEKLFSAQGWICAFVKRSQLAALAPNANAESRDILLKLLLRFKSDYEGDIFYLSTFPFKERDVEAERRLAEWIVANGYKVDHLNLASMLPEVPSDLVPAARQLDSELLARALASPTQLT